MRAISVTFVAFACIGVTACSSSRDAGTSQDPQSPERRDAGTSQDPQSPELTKLNRPDNTDDERPLLAADGQTERVQKMLNEYTEDIRTEHALILRGLGSVESLAISYSHRGEVYLHYADESKKAIDDFGAAVQHFQRAMRQAQGEDSTNRIESGLAQALLFRSRARLKLNTPVDEALKDINDAVERYEKLVKRGEETLEPVLVYGLRTRLEALERSDTGESRRLALADVDRALPLLEKWSQKGEQKAFFKKQLAEFRARRLKLAAGQADPPKQEDTPNDNVVKSARHGALAGTWAMTETEVAGERMSAPSSFTYVFRDGKVTFCVDGEASSEYTYLLNTSQSPWELDLIEEADDGKRIRAGIAQIKGEELTWCRTMKPGGTRPTQFRTRPGDGFLINVFTKAPDSRLTAATPTFVPAPKAGEPPQPLSRPARFELMFLDGPNGEDSVATDINNQGTVIGEYGSAQQKRPCLWKDGKLVPLRAFDRPHATVYGISPSGLLAGAHIVGQKAIPYLYEDDQLLELKTDVRFNAVLPYGVNDRRQVVFVSFHALETTSGYLWENNKVKSLGTLGGWNSEPMAINGRGEVAGYSTLQKRSRFHAFVWRDGTMTDLGTLGGQESKAYDINDEGHVVGHSTTSAGDTHACVWRGDKAADLGVLPGGPSSWAWSINNTGMITGWSQSAGDAQHAVYWFADGIYDLNAVTPNRDGWTLAVARAVNDSGRIAGTAVRNGKRRAFVLRPVFQDAVTASKSPDDENLADRAKADVQLEFADRPFGQWLSQREYVNNFVAPLRVKLAGNWRRAEPSAQPLYVERVDGGETEDLLTTAKPDAVKEALVLYAKADYGFAVHTLEIKFRSVPPTTTWEAYAGTEVNRILGELNQLAAMALKPITNRGKAWIDGRRCEVIDFDGFFVGQLFHTRIYLIPVNRHFLIVAWSFTDTKERKNIDAMMRDMLELGPTSNSGQPIARSEWNAHALIVEKMETAIGTKELRDKSAKIAGEIDAFAVFINYIREKLQGERGGFFGGAANRFGNLMAARSARDSAIKRVTNIALLQSDFNSLLLTRFRESLSPEEVELVRAHRPELLRRATEADSAKPPSNVTEVKKADAHTATAAPETTVDGAQSRRPAGANRNTAPKTASNEEPEFKPGDAVEVQRQGSWYDGTIFEAADPGRWKIHYNGHSSSWDEVVTRKRIRARQLKRRSWGPEQATGPPDTKRAGDCETAWASNSPDSRLEWLLLEYETPIAASAVVVHETYNPGAIAKIILFNERGREVFPWQSRSLARSPEDKRVLRVPTRPPEPARFVKLEIDARTVDGWNEIDAVGLEDSTGKVHWAVKASASSSYASGKSDPRLEAHLPGSTP